MARFTSPLNNIKVASPCSANWDEMYGTERKRHCGDCNMNVYNLSAMTKIEAERLIMNTEGRLCARFYRRPDGTILTKDCPVGLRAAKQKVLKIWTAAASLVIAFLAGIGITSLFGREEAPVIMGDIKIERPATPVEPSMGGIEPMMGNVAIDDPYVKGEEEPVNANMVMGRVANVEE
jgi:hypothetical protein